jgi:hypothetical protein
MRIRTCRKKSTGFYPVRVVLAVVASSLSLHFNRSSYAADVPLPAVVEFNRDIRPILSDNCFACHGPDQNQRKADLRLDREDGALADRGGTHPIVPGKPEESELYRRITAKDKKDRMPRAKFGKQLNQRQIELIRRWIEQGGKYQKHWSRIVPRRPELPTASNPAWARNAIDQFILARLDLEGLKPSPEADKRTLIRRLRFDLIGLPPSPQELDAFLAEDSSSAYERLVDRLLASEHFGERMALYWLDLVRYADTGGYHSDNHRDIALYRDYVIRAFNENYAFDRFTREQLSGDLLPNAAVEQKIASGYNRLLMTTEEGGAQAKEYLAKYAADRVRNVSTVWLGTTLGCAECHDHKFDPFFTREFYQFAAFFADIKEKPVGRQDQERFPNAAQSAQIRQWDEQIAAAQKVLNTPSAELEVARSKWEESLRVADVRKLPKNIVNILLIQPGQRTDSQKQTLAADHRTIAAELEPVRKKLVELQRQKDEFLKLIPSTLVSVSVPPRVMRVLPRGNWLNDSGEAVAPAVPASLTPALHFSTTAGTDKRATRLDLAGWLMAPDNPLVARVFVNRLWKLFFGQGIVKSLDDFGSQGTWPTHPELLDWLAIEFRESGWNIKHLVKLMVLASTYRQTSAASPELRQRDPYNQLLARQARFRLDAETVRDNALAVSGLLSRQIGGPSAKPYQPAGYWSLLNFPKREYQNDKGENLYRRGLYTYWCRTFPHPSLVAFDAPSREECTVDRPRSNTPLQALVLLNDPIYVEASRVFAERILRDGGNSWEGRVQLAYRLALSRGAESRESRLLEGLYQEQLREYQSDILAAQAVLTIGDRLVPPEMDVVELAAWTSVARVILNLHEAITRD